MKNQPEATVAPEPLRWRIRKWLFRELFPAEYCHLNALSRDRDWWRDRAKRATEVKPARITLAGVMSEPAIVEQLRGTESMPTVKAICAHLSAKIVLLSDRATDAPRTVCQVKGETIAGYSADERLHDAGGASYLAEALGEIQDLTKATPTAGEENRAA